MAESSLIPSRIPLLIAFKCGSEVPEQMTKKSVKDEIPRRSRTTISSAFLSSASLTQRRANSSTPIHLSPVKFSLLDILQDSLRNQIRDWQIIGNPVSDVSRRHIESTSYHRVFHLQGQVRAAEDCELHQMIQFLEFVPLGQSRNMIFADQEKKNIVWMLGMI